MDVQAFLGFVLGFQFTNHHAGPRYVKHASWLDVSLNSVDIGTILAVGISTGVALASPTATAESVCTVTSYADVPAATASCTAITIQDVTVPGNSTLNLSKLKTGTTVTFAGRTVSLS
jgi:hypothetical protein